MAAATVAIFALLVIPAMAKGPKGGGGSAVIPQSSIELESYSDLRPGGYVGFETNAVGLAGNEYPMVAVWYYQSDTTVYMALSQAGDEFLLGGAGSDWLRSDGGADCSGVLYAYSWKGGHESVRQLDSVDFQAAG